jgi:Tfp pilus assembly protein PilV
MSNFWRNKSGASLIEYALIAALVGVVVVTALSAMPKKHIATPPAAASQGGSLYTGDVSPPK